MAMRLHQQQTLMTSRRLNILAYIASTFQEDGSHWETADGGRVTWQRMLFKRAR